MYSLVLPFHSDFQRLERTLELLKHQAEKNKIKQILLCHNGPKLNFNTEEKIKEKLIPKSFLVHTDAKGVGAGYKLGIINADQKYTVLSASDLPFGFTDINSFEEFKNKNDDLIRMAIGSKAHSKSRIPGYGLKRRCASAGFWMFRALMLGWDTPRDSQGSLIIETQLAKDLIRKSEYDNYFFSVELITLAQRTGVKVVELPVVLENHEGESSVSVLQDSVKLAKNLYDFSRRLKRERPL